MYFKTKNVYTDITRGRKLVVIVGKEKAPALQGPPVSARLAPSGGV